MYSVLYQFNQCVCLLIWFRGHLRNLLRIEKLENREHERVGKFADVLADVFNFLRQHAVKLVSDLFEQNSYFCWSLERRPAIDTYRSLRVLHFDFPPEQ